MRKLTIGEIKKYCIDLLKQNSIEDYSLKTKILISNELKESKEYLITHEDEIIEENAVLNIRQNIEKIISGIPIQYIINNQEFMGLDFYVDENVLIPQPDTENLVEEVIFSVSKDKKDSKILDLCTGSGAIAIALKKHIPNSNITATDISHQALEVAKKNAKNNNVDICFLESDMFNKINTKFDIIVSNPPYIKTNIIKTLAKEVQNEPHIALDGGEDGLLFYRIIVENAYKYLEDQGYLCLEIGYDQKDEVIDIINKSKNYEGVYFKKDLSGNDRVVICKKRS